MSEREQVHQLVESLPDEKITRLLIFLQGMKFDDDIEDDIFCENLVSGYLVNNDPQKHETITLEEFAAQEGVLL